MLKSPSFPSEPCHLHTSTVLGRGIYQHSPNRAYTPVNPNEGIPEADTNQSISFDQNLGSAIDSNPACGNSFTLVPIQGAGHGTWLGPDGYSAGVGAGTPLGALTSDIQDLSMDPPAATPVAATPAAPAAPPATTPTTATPQP